MENIMLVHSVFFWLNDTLSNEQKQQFTDGLETLKAIESAEAVYVGTPSTTERPVFDKSFSFAVTVILKDVAAHDAYQVDPLHTAFLETFKPMMAKVLIYDAD